MAKIKDRIYTVCVLNPENEVIYTQDISVNKKLKLKFMPSGRAIKDAIKQDPQREVLLSFDNDTSWPADEGGSND